MWANGRAAKNKYESTAATREQVQTLIDHLCKAYGIKQVGNLLTLNHPTNIHYHLVIAYYNAFEFAFI